MHSSVYGVYFSASFMHLWFQKGKPGANHNVVKPIISPFILFCVWISLFFHIFTFFEFHFFSILLWKLSLIYTSLWYYSYYYIRAQHIKHLRYSVDQRGKNINKNRKNTDLQYTNTFEYCSLFFRILFYVWRWFGYTIFFVTEGKRGYFETPIFTYLCKYLSTNEKKWIIIIHQEQFMVLLDRMGLLLSNDLLENH